MSPVKVAAITALVLALPAAWLLLDGAGAPPPGDDAAAAAPEDARRRARVVPPPPPLAADDRDDAGDAAGAADDREPVPLFGPEEKPLPPHEDAEVFANGRLSLHVSVDPPHPRAGDPFVLVTTFRNDGTGPLRFHVPEHTGLVPFPSLELRGADGRVVIPVAASFQSEWQRGLQGDVVRLEPGEQHAVRSDVTGIAEAPEDATARERGVFAYTQKRIALPPGDFVVTAALDTDKTTVPFGKDGFRAEQREVPGLWTGSVRSSPITIRVAPPDQPLLTLRGPDRLTPGGEMALELTVANPSSEPREIRGAFALRRSQKGGPGYVAWFAFGDTAVPARPDHSRALRLEPGASRVCRLDVGALAWERVGRKRDVIGRTQWPFGRVYPAIWVTCGVRGEDGPGWIGSNTMFVPLEAARDLSDRGLAVVVSTHGLSATPPYVDVRLLHRGSAPVPVHSRLRSPRYVSLELHAHGEDRRPVVIAVPDEEPLTLLGSEDLMVLSRGGSLHARIPLAADWQAGVAPGTYDLRAHWMSLDACDRPGFEVRPVVGRVSSAPAPVEIRAR